jgi:type IV secretory pathway TraG/TraD family ATPase VirD4
LVRAVLAERFGGERGYESGSDHFFRQSSRTLLESLLQVATPREPQSIPRLLELNRDELKQALSGTPAYSLMDPGAHEQGAGIIATVANATRPFLYLPPFDGRPSWSALEWAERPEGWLFMTIRDDSSSAALPLANLWLDLIVGRLLNSTKDRRRVWIVVDELPVLGRQAKLETLVTRGRKRGLAAVLGYQSIAQLRRIYGREQAARACLDAIHQAPAAGGRTRNRGVHRAPDRGTRNAAIRDRNERG